MLTYLLTYLLNSVVKRLKVGLHVAGEPLASSTIEGVDRSGSLMAVRSDASGADTVHPSSSSSAAATTTQDATVIEMEDEGL